MAEVKIKPRKIKMNPGTLVKAVDRVFNHLLEEELSVLVDEMGSLYSCGELDDLLEDPTNEYDRVDAPGVDIFGQPLSVNPNIECECSNCGRAIDSTRFAFHLEKCIGIGRNCLNSRLSSLGSNNCNAESYSVDVPSNSTASTSGQIVATEASSSGSQVKDDIIWDNEYSEQDDGDDEEWTMKKKKKTKKKGKARTTCKNMRGVGRGRNPRTRGAKISDPPYNNSFAPIYSDQEIEIEVIEL